MNQKRIDPIVDALLKSMSDHEKMIVRTTSKHDLISSLYGWGTTIRNKYNLWQDTELVRATGTEHADDASIVIIEAVWERLQGE